MKFGIQPCAVIGHSLGEYAALAVAGVLSDSDTVFLVGTRAAILKSKCPAYTHGMVSVRASIANIRHEADGLSFEVACINSPKETVIGGTINCLDVFATRLSKAGCSTTRLDLPHAYHTAQMDDVVDQLILQTQGITYNKPSIPVMSPQDSAIINAGACINPSYLSTSYEGRLILLVLSMLRGKLAWCRRPPHGSSWAITLYAAVLSAAHSLTKA